MEGSDMMELVEYEVALVDGSVERLKDRLQRFADQGFRVVATAQNIVIMERKAKSEDQDGGVDG
jgi:hypothetical protein